MKAKLKTFLEGVVKFIAKSFNELPKTLRIALMIAIGSVLATWTNLVIRDIQGLNLTNDYVKAFIDGLLPVMTIVYNLILEFVRQKGTDLLAAEGDPKTMLYLQDKLVNAINAKNLANNGKNNNQG